jgi:hypothetical protein
MISSASGVGFTGSAPQHSRVRAAMCGVLSLATLLLPAPALSADVNASEPPELQSQAIRIQARAYAHGEGVRKDLARALALYCEGARAGDAEAQFSLGWIYANGRGVARQDSVASYYFMLAAAQGHPQAANMLSHVGEPNSEVPECLRPRQAAHKLPVPAQTAVNDFLPMEEFVPTTPAQKKALQLVNELAPRFGVIPRLAIAVIRAESNFDPAARSPKNAQGLMQLIPETSLRFNVTKPFDPSQNVRGGLAYLRWLLAYFEGDVALVAAAYNAGEGTVNKYRGVPPYPETRAYVERIRQFFGRDAHPFDAAVVEPSPELPRIRQSVGTPVVNRITPISWSAPRER